MEHTQGFINFEGYEDKLKERKEAFDKKYEGKKVEFEYQELGIEMQKYFKKNIWYLFWKYNEEDIKYAYEQCKKYDKPHVPYLVAIIRKRKQHG